MTRDEVLAALSTRFKGVAMPEAGPEWDAISWVAEACTLFKYFFSIEWTEDGWRVFVADYGPDVRKYFKTIQEAGTFAITMLRTVLWEDGWLPGKEPK